MKNEDLKKIGKSLLYSSKLLRSIKNIFAQLENALAFVEAQVEWWCLLTLNNLAGFSVDFLEENLKTFFFCHQRTGLIS